MKTPGISERITGYVLRRKHILDLQNRGPCTSEGWSKLVFWGTWIEGGHVRTGVREPQPRSRANSPSFKLELNGGNEN